MNYIYKHWRGELSLTISFWINIVLLNLVIRLTRYYLKSYDIIENPIIIAREIIIFSAFIFFILYPWQIIGLWRCCNNHIKKNGRRFWARTSQVIIIFAVIFLFAGLKYQWPNYKKHLMICFEKDDEFGICNLTMEKNNTLIHLEGNLSNGTSNKVVHLLKKYPKIEGIMLDSSGGSTYEGRALSKIISAYDINTYSSTVCYSAAATAFMGGKNRFLIRGANLGFHQPSLGSKKLADAKTKKEEEKETLIFQQHGVKKEFTDKMFNTPPDDLYFPKYSELLKQGVVHKVIFYSEIIPEANQTGTNDFNDVSLNGAVFEIIRQYEPNTYKMIKELLNKEIKNGADKEYQEYIKASFKKRVTEQNLSRTSDEAIIRYIREKINNLKKIEVNESFICLKIICPEEYGYSNIFKYIKPNQILNVIDDVIIDAYKKHNPAIDDKVAELLLKKLYNELGTDANNLNINNQDLKNSKQYKQYCDIVFKFYELILSEDKTKAGNLLRYLYRNQDISKSIPLATGARAK